MLLLLEEESQPVADYEIDSFDSSVDCSDQATSCTTDCSDSDDDGLSDCLDLCLDYDLDCYGTDNSDSVIGGGSAKGQKAVKPVRWFAATIVQALWMFVMERTTAAILSRMMAVRPH